MHPPLLRVYGADLDIGFEKPYSTIVIGEPVSRQAHYTLEAAKTLRRSSGFVERATDGTTKGEGVAGLSAKRPKN